MSVSSIDSSPTLQWLQSYLSGSGPATEKPLSCGAQFSSDTTSISQEAVQLNASQTLQAPDPSRASGVNGSQGHHHHHHYGGGQGANSFVQQLGQSIVADLQNATGGGVASGSEASAATAQTSANGGSFIDKLAGVIASDLVTSGSAGSSSQSSKGNQVNATA